MQVLLTKKVINVGVLRTCTHLTERRIELHPGLGAAVSLSGFYSQIKHGNQSHARIEAERAAAAKKKTTDDELRDLNKLLKPVTEMPKVARGVHSFSGSSVFAIAP